MTAQSAPTPLRIALLGYGRMGRAIEAAATAQGHRVVLRIDPKHDPLHALDTAPVEVAIDFTHPDAVLANIRAVLDRNIPLVVGTTGWAQHQAEVADWVQQSGGTLIYGSNFSIGVNLLFVLNRMLARLMAPYNQYDVGLEEQHHRHKADSPSGTARTLANDILANLPRKQHIADPATLATRPPHPDELTIAALRTGEIPGTHTVRYASATDSLSLTHTAHTRDGFAEGAVIAAAWAQGLQGFHDFSVLFSDKKH